MRNPELPAPPAAPASVVSAGVPAVVRLPVADNMDME